MNEWLQYLLESQVCLTALFVLYLLFFKKLSFFQWNRFYLLLIVGLSLLIPAVNYETTPEAQLFAFTSVHWELPEEAQAFEQPDATQFEEVKEKSAFSLIPTLFFTYWLGAFIAFALLMKKISSMLRLIRKSPKEKYGSYVLVTPPFDCTPFSFFGYIFLSKSIQQLIQGKKEQIIAHEMAHVSQCHSLDIIFLEIVSIFFWFNPVIYFVNKSIRLIHEFLADAFVTEHHSSSTYFKLILDVASREANSISNPFTAKRIKQRILFQQNQKSNYMQKLKFLAALPIVGILVLAFSCSTSQELNSGSGEDGTFTVILDPGHGGADPGFISQDNVNEKDINLQLAKRIKSLAPEYNINVLMTRDDDQFMALKDRTQSFSETGYDLFISMHANADNNDSKAGIESYYAENENAATSRLFLDIFRKELSADSYPFVLREEFMKPANFVVLKTNTSPAVLIEAGFLSNEEDMKKLLSDDYATELSKTLLASISKYREQLEGE